MQEFYKAKFIPNSEKDAAMMKMIEDRFPGAPKQIIKKMMEEIRSQEVWMNDTYTVSIDDANRVSPVHPDFPEMLWLSIKRNDRQPIHDWRDLQEIKNMLVGEENEACELYPAKSRTVDTANQYHLWVFKDKTVKFPFGFREGVVDYDLAGKVGAVQRQENN
jgi:hypothetical protein